jgi:hypothetical protein
MRGRRDSVTPLDTGETEPLPRKSLSGRVLATLQGFADLVGVVADQTDRVSEILLI